MLVVIFMVPLILSLVINLNQMLLSFCLTFIILLFDSVLRPVFETTALFNEVLPDNVLDPDTAIPVCIIMSFVVFFFVPMIHICKCSGFKLETDGRIDGSNFSPL